MEKTRVKRILVELYNEFQYSVIEREKRSGGKYDDINFDSLSSFMSFIYAN